MDNFIQINSLYNECKQLFNFWNDEFQFKLTEYIRLLKQVHQKALHYPFFIIKDQLNKGVVLEEHNNKIFYYSIDTIDNDILLLESLLNIKIIHNSSLNLFNTFDSTFNDYNYITLGNALNISGATSPNIINSMFGVMLDETKLIAECNMFTEFKYLKRLIDSASILLRYSYDYSNGYHPFWLTSNFLSKQWKEIIQSYFYVLPLSDILTVVKHSNDFSKKITTNITYFGNTIDPAIKVLSIDKALSMASKFVETTIPKLNVRLSLEIAKEYND